MTPERLAELKAMPASEYIHRMYAGLQEALQEVERLQAKLSSRSSTMNDLDAIEARANAATEGPWFAVESDDDLFMTRYLVSTEREGDEPDTLICGTLVQNPMEFSHPASQWEEDAHFIAHARTDIPAMVKELRELRAERLELLGFVHSAESYAAGQISGDELCEEINRWSMSHDA